MEMERAVAFGAISGATAFLNYFKDFPDTRQRCKVVSPLDELLAMLGSAEAFANIARFGEKKLGLCAVRPFGKHWQHWARLNLLVNDGKPLDTDLLAADAPYRDLLRNLNG